MKNEDKKCVGKTKNVIFTYNRINIILGMLAYAVLMHWINTSLIKFMFLFF